MALEIDIKKYYAYDPTIDRSFWVGAVSDGVQVDMFRGANGEQVAGGTLSYEEYEEFRQKVPNARLPVFREPTAEGEAPPGNTVGHVVGPTAASTAPAVKSNPPVEPETPEEQGFWSSASGWAHGALDVAGFVPGLGAIPDLLNAGIYALEGNYSAAAISAVAAVPGFGDAIKGGTMVGKAASRIGTHTAKEAAEHSAEVAAREAAEKAAKEKAEREAAEQAASKGKDGGKSKGRQRRDCRLRPYSQGCPGGKTPHHVVPDRVFKSPSGQRYRGGLTHAQGLCVCVDGRTPVRRGPRPNEHGLIHGIYDPAEAVLGANGDPAGTAPLGELEALGVASASAVTGCNPVAMAAQLRAYHQGKGLSITDRFRADPRGTMVRGVDPSRIGRGATQSGSGGL